VLANTAGSSISVSQTGSDDPDTQPCWWRIHRPFARPFGADELQAMSMAVTFFQGESIFADNTFEDTGHLQVSNLQAHKLIQI
jgi:hypothetical protein